MGESTSFVVKLYRDFAERKRDKREIEFFTYERVRINAIPVKCNAITASREKEKEKQNQTANPITADKYRSLSQ